MLNYFDTFQDLQNCTIYYSQLRTQMVNYKVQQACETTTSLPLFL